MKKGARAQGDLVWGLHAVEGLLARSPERVRRVSVLAGRRDKRLADLLERGEVTDARPEDFKRYGSARKLYNFNIDNIDAY